jgi:hypothetical protein
VARRVVAHVRLREMRAPTRRPVRCRSGRAPSLSTDDRLTLASVSSCGSADVVVRQERWSAGATAVVTGGRDFRIRRGGRAALAHTAGGRPGVECDEWSISTRRSSLILRLSRWCTSAAVRRGRPRAGKSGISYRRSCFRAEGSSWSIGTARACSPIPRARSSSAPRRDDPSSHPTRPSPRSALERSLIDVRRTVPTSVHRRRARAWCSARRGSR